MGLMESFDNGNINDNLKKENRKEGRILVK
jgi:hypothetical protein